MDSTANLSCPETGSVTPAQLGTSSYAASSYPSTPCSRIPGCDIRNAGRTVKEYDKEIEDLRKENFSLKLRIYLLEQRFSEAVGHDVAETVQANVQLHIQLETIQNEMRCKGRMLEETIKTAKENEIAYRRAKEKISTLEKEISGLKEELSHKNKCSTPERSRVNDEAFKEAFGLWTPYNQPSFCGYSERVSDPDRRDTFTNLQRDLIVKDLEVQQSKATIKQLEETIEGVQLQSKKKSKVIQSLVHELHKVQCDKIEINQMLEAVNCGIEAAKNKDISQVLNCVSQIKLHFCELVSMTPEELFQEKCISTSVTGSVVMKEKRIQDVEECAKTYPFVSGKGPVKVSDVKKQLIFDKFRDKCDKFH